MIFQPLPELEERLAVVRENPSDCHKILALAAVEELYSDNREQYNDALEYVMREFIQIRERR